MRRALAAVFLVLACVLPAVALGTWWAYGLATSTDRFMDVGRPLASDEHVQSEVADELVSVANARLASAGVPDLPVARQQVRAQAEALVATPAYRGAWLTVQRNAHAKLAVRLDGDVRTPLTLDLAPVAAALRARLRANTTLAPLAAAIADPAPVTVLDAGEVHRAQQATNTVRIVRGIAIPGSVLALLGVLLTAGSLAAGLVRGGLAIGVSTALVWGGDALARSAITSGGDVGRLRLAVYDVLTDGLHHWMIGGAALAVALVAVGAAVSAVSR